MQRVINRKEREDFVAAHPDVELWLEGLAEATKGNYVRAMIIYTEFHDMQPHELLAVKENGGTKAERLLDTFIMKSKDFGDAKKKIIVTAVHSFYKNHYLDLASRSGYSKVTYVAANDQKCPTQEELRENLLDAHVRNRAVVNVISSGGFRVGTARQLTWGDFAELWAWDGQTPIYVCIDSKRLKGKGYQGTVEQHTFMTKHACEVLLRYAEWYRSKRDLTDESPLFVSRGGTQHAKPFTAMSNGGLWRAVTYLGPFGPHDLRRFAQTGLETARVNPNWIKKMQGKKLRGEDNPYSKPKIEEMRKAFRLAEPHLTLAPPALGLDAIAQRKQALLDSAELLFGDDKEKMFELQNLLKKVTTEQELKDAKEKWWNSRI